MTQPGLELLFDSVASQLRSSEDAVICVLHWNIVTSGFKCVGIGETGTKKKKTESLPRGWNESPDVYVLRYQENGSSEEFVLKVVKVDDSLMVHFMRSRDEKVTGMNIRVATYTTGDFADLDSAFKNLHELEKRFKTEVLRDFQKKSPESTAASSSRSQRNQGRSSLEDDDPLRVPGHRRQLPRRDWEGMSDPFAVGRGDLDPLAGGMGGMLMDPRRGGGQGFGPDPDAGLPGRLPPGAVPPGARFDPFGPPGTRPVPDPDHMKPPDYDDMFM